MVSSRLRCLSGSQSGDLLRRCGPLLHDRGRLARPLDLPGHGNPLSWVARHLGCGEGKSGVQDEGVCDGSLLSPEDVQQHLGVYARVPSLEVLNLAARNPQVLWEDLVLLHSRLGDFHDVRGARGRQLIDSHRVHYQSILEAELLQCVCHELLDLPRVHADQGVRNGSGVQHRAQNVERSPDLEGLSDGHDGLHGGVEPRCEHEPYAGLREALLHLLGAQVDNDAKVLQDVRASAQARDGPIAVLGDRQAARRGEDAGSRRDVHGPRAVPAGSHDVHGGFVHRHGRHLLLHRGGEPGNFRGRLPLRAQQHQEGSDLRRVPLVHEVGQYVLRHSLGEVLGVAELLQHGRNLDIAHGPWDHAVACDSPARPETLSPPGGVGG
mmetsp:Transcript_4140/g.14782  ORF Transcript_4140/g.14782 Transcript_4140/m.14782 type:complete len:380 (-) Transcript_4140:123-1262(-)